MGSHVAAFAFWTLVGATAIARPPDPAILFDVPMRLDNDYGYLVDLAVAKRPAAMIIDTGSSLTFIQSWYQRSMTPAGSPPSDLPIRMGSFTTQSSYAVIDDIPGAKAARIAGILSPQDVSPLTWVVADFRAQHLMGLADTEHTLPFLRSQFAEIGLSPLPWVGHTVGAILVSASFGTRHEISVDVDSGAPYTTLSTAYLGSADSQHTRQLVGADGKAHAIASRSSSESISLGALSLPDVAVRSRDSVPVYAGISVHGRIGRDLLRSCVIALPPRPRSVVYVGCARSP